MFDFKTHSYEDKYNVTYIDGKPYVAILPICGDDINQPDENHFAELLSFLVSRKQVDRLHAVDISSFSMAPASICFEKNYTGEPRVITIGGPTPGFRGTLSMFETCDNVGYRPVLVPLDPETLQPDFDVLPQQRFKSAQAVTLGTLYLNEIPVDCPQNPTTTGDILDYIPGTTISIRDTSQDPNKQLHWIHFAGMLICDRVLLKNIDWFTLDEQGLVFGFTPNYNENASEESDYEEDDCECMCDNCLEERIHQKVAELYRDETILLDQMLSYMLSDDNCEFDSDCVCDHCLEERVYQKIAELLWDEKVFLDQMLSYMLPNNEDDFDDDDDDFDDEEDYEAYLLGTVHGKVDDLDIEGLELLDQLLDRMILEDDYSF